MSGQNQGSGGLLPGTAQATAARSSRKRDVCGLRSSAIGASPSGIFSWANLHFTLGDPEGLAAKVEWAWTHPNAIEEVARAARHEYEAKYTAERNYQTLIQRGKVG